MAASRPLGIGSGSRWELAATAGGREVLDTVGMAETSGMKDTHQRDAQRLVRVERMLARVPGEWPNLKLSLTDSAGSKILTLPHRPPHLLVSRTAADAHDQALLGELAHELAHLDDPIARTLRRQAIAGMAALLAIALMLLIMHVVVGDSTPIARIVQSVLWLAAWLAIAASALWLQRCGHRIEYRADQRAAHVLGDVTPVLAMLERAHFDHERLSRMARLGSRITHPTPTARQHALGANTPMTLGRRTQRSSGRGQVAASTGRSGRRRAREGR